MINPGQFELMAKYNRWMNERVYDVCANIPDVERKKDLGAFFGSIHSTLNHILYGDRAWMGRFVSEPFGITRIGQDLYDDFQELRSERASTDERILEWSKSLEEDWLNADFEFKSNVDGLVRKMPTWVLVTHMFNHQTHHRGQLTTLLSQLDIDLGTTDIPWMPEFEQ